METAVWLLVTTLANGPTDELKHVTRHFDNPVACQLAATDMAALLRDMHEVTKIECSRISGHVQQVPKEKKSETF